jgi:Gpi18-like mannosyltransferase
MSIILGKKDLFKGLLRFVETRLLIVLIGVVCYSIFPERGQVYHQKNIREVISVTNVWNHFDSQWYQKLAKEGYPKRHFTDNTQETWGYMPLYSITLKLFSWLFGGNLFYTGIFVSNCFSLLGLFIIYKLAHEKFNSGLDTVTLMLTCAGSFYLSIVYAEGLFVFLTALVFYLSHKKKYGWAVIIAGLASVTRIQGCLLFIVPAIEIITYHLRTCYKYIPAFIVSLLPMAALMLYLNNTCGEPLAFIKIQHAWGSADLFPMQGFIHLFSPDFPGSSIINALFWVMIVGLVLVSYRKLPLSYVLFTIAYFLLSVSNEVVYGTTRYMLGVLPLFFAVSLGSNHVKQFFLVINLLFLGITIGAFVTITPTFI